MCEIGICLKQRRRDIYRYIHTYIYGICVRHALLCVWCVCMFVCVRERGRERERERESVRDWNFFECLEHLADAPLETLGV